MKIPELKEVIKMLTSDKGLAAAGGSMTGGAAGGVYGGLSEKSDDESRMARILKYMGLGTVAGAGAGIGGGIAGKSLGIKYGPAVRDMVGRPATKIKGVERGQNAFTGAMTGAGLAGTAAGLGTSAVADKYGAASIQGFMDKCAERGFDAEKLAQAAAKGYVAENDMPVVSKAERAQDAAWRVKAEAEQRKNPPKEDSPLPAVVPAAKPAVKSNEYQQGYMAKLAQLQAVRKIQMTKEFIKRLLSDAPRKPIIPAARPTQYGTLKPRMG